MSRPTWSAKSRLICGRSRGRRTSPEGPKTSDRGRFVLVQEVFEGHGSQTRPIENGEFLAHERPRHLALRITRFAAAANDEQCAAGPGKCAQTLDRAGSQRGRLQHLQRVAFVDEVETPTPVRRR